MLENFRANVLKPRACDRVRVGMGCTISIETSKRQNGAGFKVIGLVLHCASLPRTIFASSARAHERVHVQNVRDFPQTKLDNGINSPFS